MFLWSLCWRWVKTSMCWMLVHGARWSLRQAKINYIDHSCRRVFSQGFRNAMKPSTRRGQVEGSLQETISKKKKKRKKLSENNQKESQRLWVFGITTTWPPCKKHSFLLVWQFRGSTVARTPSPGPRKFEQIRRRGSRGGYGPNDDGRWRGLWYASSTTGLVLPSIWNILYPQSAFKLPHHSERLPPSKVRPPIFDWMIFFEGFLFCQVS